MTLTVSQQPGVAPRHGVIALSGYGIRVAMERGQLVTEDGVGSDRRVQRFSRVRPGFDRLVIIGHTGTVTLDALRWLHDVRIAFVHIDGDGSLITVGTGSTARDTRVRRGQASASVNGAGLAVARQLLAGKVEAQAAVVGRLPQSDGVAADLERVVQAIEAAESVDRARYLESRAAAAYWSAWQDVPTQFVAKDAKRVPTHWRTFGTRSSPLSASPRKAANPANALLNYLYSLLEAEARLALLAVGCDLGLSVIHAEQPYRDSFALDLMEPVRPHVDSFVLHLLGSRQFARGDFFELRDGCCRLMPGISQPLAATCQQWAALLAPVAEHVAAKFARASRESGRANAAPDRSPSIEPPARPIRTPLTGRNHSRRQTARGHVVAAPASYMPAQCKQCGVSVRATRELCDICLAAHPTRAGAKAADVAHVNGGLEVRKNGG